MTVFINPNLSIFYFYQCHTAYFGKSIVLGQKWHLCKYRILVQLMFHSGKLYTIKELSAVHTLSVFCQTRHLRNNS